MVKGEKRQQTENGKNEKGANIPPYFPYSKNVSNQSKPEGGGAYMRRLVGGQLIGKSNKRDRLGSRRIT
jgi:hypothetical protein